MRTLLVSLCALLVGCSADSSVVADAPTPSTLRTSGDVDLYFHPTRLASGESVTVESGSSRLESTATDAGHHVSIRTAGQRVLRLVGLLDGRQQHAVDAGGGASHKAGVTAKTPTSVHTLTVCEGDVCTTVKEYDYDLHDPSGQGTTLWTAPDGQTLVVDRLRYVVEAEADAERRRANRHVTVTTPQPLRLAR